MLAANAALLIALAAVTPSTSVESAAPATPVRVEPTMQAGLGLFWVPASVVMSGLSGESSANPGAQAFGIRPTFDRLLSPHLSLGLALPVLLNLRHAGMAYESATEADLLLRIAGWLPLSASTQLYGFAGAGAYVILLPDGAGAEHAHDPIGFAAVFGCGGRWFPAPSWFLSAEAGLHIGVKPGGLRGGSYPAATQYLDLGLGVGLPF